MAILYATVEQGKLQGVVGSNPKNSIFKYIPYAAPPVGHLRFKAPQPAIPWDGVRKADTFGEIPFQPDFNEIASEDFYLKEFWSHKEEYSEDCLYLNISTPAESENDKLPVFFWIHGGAFRSGYSFEPEFDGEGFCKRGVIFVSINYRLGIFGFFTHKDLSKENPDNISGNYGILDQIAALKWIRRNIAKFGGDPDNITICGQSAGAISAQILTSSPLTKGDIKKAIMMSGAGIPSLVDEKMFTLKESEEMGEQFLKKIGCNSIKELREINAKDLVYDTSDMDQDLKFWPIIDGYVIKKHIDEIALLKENHDISYMLGSTKDEIKDFIKESANEFIKRSKSKLGEYAEKYLALNNIKTEAWKESSIDMANKLLFGINMFASVQDDRGKPCYIYYFDKNIPGEDNPGTFHSSELWYLFQTIDRCWRRFKGSDYELSNMMADYFANFAKNGNPNGENLPKWDIYKKSAPLSMNLGESVKMKLIELMFWSEKLQ